jgi:hypothetical protein
VFPGTSAAASKEDLGNSLKAYDKAYTPVGSILRLEPTINEGAPFRSYRPQEGDCVLTG